MRDPIDRPRQKSWMDRPWIPGSIAIAIGLFAAGQALRIDEASHGTHGPESAGSQGIRLESLDVSWRPVTEPRPIRRDAASNAGERASLMAGETPPTVRMIEPPALPTPPTITAAAPPAPKPETWHPATGTTETEEAPPSVEDVRNEARSEAPGTSIGPRTTDGAIGTAAHRPPAPAVGPEPALVPQTPGHGQDVAALPAETGTIVTMTATASPASEPLAVQAKVESDAEATGLQASEPNAPALVIGHIPPAIHPAPVETEPQPVRAKVAAQPRPQPRRQKSPGEPAEPLDPEAALWGRNPQFLEALRLNKP